MEVLARLLVGEWHREYNPERGEQVPPSIYERTTPYWLIQTFGEDADAEFQEAVDLAGERWTFALIGGKAHLLRLTSTGALQTRFLAPLLGGDYVEEMSDDGLRLTFQHWRLDAPLRFDAAHRERFQPVRAALRGWAETPSLRGAG